MCHGVPGVAALKRSAYLTADDNEPRARRSADVTTVCIGLIFVLWGCYAFGKSDPLQETLSQFAQALPEWAVALLALSYTLGLILALVLVVAFIYRRRWSAVRDVAIAGIGASITTIVIVAISDELWPPFSTSSCKVLPGPQFPIVRVALVAAVLVAATPYVARPIRRIGWTVVVLISIAAVVCTQRSLWRGHCTGHRDDLRQWCPPTVWVTCRISRRGSRERGDCGNRNRCP